MKNKQILRYQAGDHIGGQYKVIHALAGGMGEVYLCEVANSNDRVALKTFQLKMGANLQKAFNDEANHWITIGKHSNIVRCREVQTIDDTPFMVLDWVENNTDKGISLADWLKHGRIPVDQAVKFAVDIAQGLAHMSSVSPGLIHRDLKPENILIDHDLTAKITDFGLAKLTNSTSLITPQIENTSNVGHHTSMKHSALGGSWPYMAPEQWHKDQPLDERTDIYAVGCILYKMLTGRTPYTGGSFAEFQQQHEFAEIPSLPSELPWLLRRTIKKCLAKKQKKRITNIAALQARLLIIYLVLTGDGVPEPEQEPFESLEHIYNARVFLDIDKPESAIRAYTKFLQEEKSAFIYAHRGHIYHTLKRHNEAFQDFSKALELTETEEFVYFYRGLLFYELNQFDLAFNDFNAALKCDSEMAEAYNGRGQIYQIWNQFDEALSDYNQSILYNPSLIDSNFKRGQIFQKQGEASKAIIEYTITIRSKPKYYLAYNGRGLCYERLGMYEKALQDFHEAARIDRTSANVYRHQGRQYENLEKYHRAIQSYSNSIGLTPSYKAFIDRGVIHRYLGSYDKAIEDFGEALQLSKSRPEPYYHKGLTYYRMAHYQDAIEHGEKALQLDQKPYHHHYLLGKCYAQLKEFKKAIAHFSQAIVAQPDRSYLYCDRGDSYYLVDQIENALADYKQAVQANPKDAQALRGQANCYDALGSYEHALQLYSQSLQIDPHNAQAYYNRGVVYLHSGKNHDAVDDFSEAIRLDQSDFSYFQNRSIAYVQLGQLDKACIGFGQAIQLDPKPAENHLRRSGLYKELGRLEEALTDVTKALELDESLAAAWELRASLYLDSKKQYAEAVHDLTRLLRLQPQNAEGYFMRGFAYTTGLHQYQLALKDLNLAIELNQELIEVYELRAAILSKLERYDEAITDYDVLIAHTPDQVEYYQFRAQQYIKQKKYQEALTDCKTAWELNPEDTETLFQTGCILATLQDWLRALTCFEKMTVLNDPRGAIYAERIHQRLEEQASYVPAENDDYIEQLAHQAFAACHSLNDMRQAVKTHPLLREMMPIIEIFLAESATAVQKEEYEPKLTWLRQVLEGC